MKGNIQKPIRVVSRGDYAKHVAARLRGEPGAAEILKHMVPEPLPPTPWQWQWWRKRTIIKVRNWYYSWKRGEWSRPGKCACGRWQILHYTPSNTAYHWDGKGKDPNAPKYLCRPCSEQYSEIMQGQWDDYYRGLL